MRNAPNLSMPVTLRNLAQHPKLFHLPTTVILRSSLHAYEFNLLHPLGSSESDSEPEDSGKNDDDDLYEMFQQEISEVRLVNTVVTPFFRNSAQCIPLFLPARNLSDCDNFTL